MSRTLCGAIIVAAAGASTAPALAEGVVVDLSLEDIGSWDELGEAPNTVLTVDVADLAGFGSGQSLFLTGLGYDLTLETFGFSWLSEAEILFEDADAPGSGFLINPAAGDDFAGTDTYTQSLTKFVPQNQFFLTNGVLRIEFYESFDDIPNTLDAQWNGTLTLQVDIPSPGAAPLLLAAFVGAARRRRS